MTLELRPNWAEGTDDGGVWNVELRDSPVQDENHCVYGLGEAQSNYPEMGWDGPSVGRDCSQRTLMATSKGFFRTRSVL